MWRIDKIIAGLPLNLNIRHQGVVFVEINVPFDADTVLSFPVHSVALRFVVKADETNLLRMRLQFSGVEYFDPTNRSPLA